MGFLPPPRFVFMEVNKRCNLRCTHCDFWLRTDDDRAAYLSLDRKLDILSEFAELNPEGQLVICGGEPMLDLDEYFGLCTGARARGLRVLSVVNGTRIRRPEMAERLIEEGPHEISISLNSHRRDLHDETRGVPGAFDKAARALRLLVDAKKRLGADTRIIVMSLIFSRNYREIDGFFDFVLNDVGADQLKLNCIQPSFGRDGQVDDFFATEGEVDGDEFMRLIRACDRKYGLELNQRWIEVVGMYFRSLAAIKDRDAGWASSSGTTHHICNTYERNVMINHYGVARLCFSTAFPGRALEAPGDFTRFWTSANGIRAKMRNCNKYCGISHSVRREASTRKGAEKLAAFETRFGNFPAPGMAIELREALTSFMGR